MNNPRYSRQILLPHVGEAGQEKIHNARILCIGAGGLGAPVLQYLASAGIGKIGIIDSDTVDISNLQRQVIFQTEDIGKPKALLAKSYLERLNPEIHVTAHCTHLDSNNVLSIMSDYDLIIDGSDNFDTKFLVNDAAFKLNLPFVYGSIFQFEGHVALFQPNIGACYRCLYPAPPQALVLNCAESGVLGSLAGVIGSLQATLAINAIISQNFKNNSKHEHPLSPELGKLTVFSADKMEFHSFKIPKNKQCPTCSKNPRDVSLQSESYFCQNNAPATTLHELYKIIEKKEEKLLLLDVREPHETELNKIQNSICFPLSKLSEKDPDLSILQPYKNQTLIVFCEQGIRSQMACSRLKTFGFTKALNLPGGIKNSDASELLSILSSY